jgi:hypothetical protein
VIHDGEKHVAVIWDSQNKRTESIPLVRINVDELQERALSL